MALRLPRPRAFVWRLVAFVEIVSVWKCPCAWTVNREMRQADASTRVTENREWRARFVETEGLVAKTVLLVQLGLPGAVYPG